MSKIGYLQVVHLQHGVIDNLSLTFGEIVNWDKSEADIQKQVICFCAVGSANMAVLSISYMAAMCTKHSHTLSSQIKPFYLILAVNSI